MATSPTTYSGKITDIAGFRVGHYTDLENGTGCTVLICDEPAIAGIDVRGAAPGSRETELLRPGASVERVDAIMLSGGSAFGLDAAGGAVRYLEENGKGLNVGRARIPIVPSAIIFDLGFITHRVRPNADDGYAACRAAGVDFERGTVGAGTGATAGKLAGAASAVKSGIGTAAVRLPGGATVAALVVVNALGGVVDPATGEIIAGPRTDRGYVDSVDLAINSPPNNRWVMRNTTIGVVATDAPLDRIGATRLAVAGQDGIALAVRPAHTTSDGDTIFGLSIGQQGRETSPDALHAAALRAVTGAILDAVLSATALGGLPAATSPGRSASG